jgi:hypothetical protein
MTDKEIEEMTQRLKKQAEDRMIKYPITVTGVEFKVDPPVSKTSWQRNRKVGMYVAIRSCKKDHGDKTRLGILIGWVPVHSSVEFLAEEGKKDTGKLVFYHNGQNPAIFVPDLNEVVLGCESWWGPIESPEQLREITDGDIQNVWYVKAMNTMFGEKKE